MTRTFLLVSLVFAGCGGGTAPDAATSPDVGLDAAAVVDDAAALEDAATSMDGAADDASAEDAPIVHDAQAADAPTTEDAGMVGDAGRLSDCASAGGTCVPVVPDACAVGIVGNPDWYGCGGGLGVMCCLPVRTPPTCRAIGTRSEGWYQADGTLVCYVACDGASLSCDFPGTRSEGWYATPDTAGCGPTAGLVRWDDCAP